MGKKTQGLFSGLQKRKLAVKIRLSTSVKGQSSGPMPGVRPAGQMIGKLCPSSLNAFPPEPLTLVCIEITHQLRNVFRPMSYTPPPPSQKHILTLHFQLFKPFPLTRLVSGSLRVGCSSSLPVDVFQNWHTLSFIKLQEYSPSCCLKNVLVSLFHTIAMTCDQSFQNGAKGIMKLCIMYYALCNYVFQVF